MGDVFDKIGSGISRAVTAPGGPSTVQDILGTGGPPASAEPQAQAPAQILPRMPDILAAPKPPAPPATIPVPDPTSPSAQRARQQQIGNAGRSATILTRAAPAKRQAGASAGMGDYSRTTLAAG
jgi:hypothetical protein